MNGALVQSNILHRYATLGLMLTLAACGGATSNVPTGPSNAKPNAQSSSPASPQSTQLLPTSFVFGKPTQPTAAIRRAQYITNSVTSVKIQLTAVNGTTPAANLVTSVTSALTPATCPCTIAGPSAPAGQDTFTLTTYDSASNAIATATSIATITASTANTVPITLNGIPSTATIGALSGTAGTPFATPQTVAVAVLDADGGTILGAYSAPVTLADSDTSGATTLATSGADNPGTLQLISSSDTATLAYTGLAIPTATISATIGGQLRATAGFTPTLQPIVTDLPLNGSTPQVTFTTLQTANVVGHATEVGWTNAPYNRALSVTVPSGCSSIGNLVSGANSTATGTLLTASSALSPGNATCSATISDFAGGQTRGVTLAKSTSTNTLSYTGSPQTLTIPFGVTLVHVVAAGAQGGSGATASAGVYGGAGGQGAIIAADVPVTAGLLTIEVGGKGEDGMLVSNVGSGSTVQLAGGGYNGGGNAGPVTCTPLPCTKVVFGGAGGGATSIAQSGSALMIAGGGGGGGILCNSAALVTGGAAGFPNGASIAAPTGCSASALAGGGGGTQTAGGTGPGSPGTAGTGGDGQSQSYGGGTVGGGAGGGGGYYGGGGGSNGGVSAEPAGGGGGGSSYVVPAGSNASQTGSNSGNGSATISW